MGATTGMGFRLMESARTGTMVARRLVRRPTLESACEAATSGTAGTGGRVSRETRPVEEKTIAPIQSFWPSSVPRDSPVTASQTLMVWSLDVEASSRPLGEKVTFKTGPR